MYMYTRNFHQDRLPNENKNLATQLEPYIKRQQVAVNYLKLVVAQVIPENTVREAMEDIRSLFKE